MDDITQQNAALAEQAAAGSIAMSEQSTNMTQLLSFFRVNSKKGASAAVRPVVRSKAPMPIAKKTVSHTVSSSSKSKSDSSDEWEEF